MKYLLHIYKRVENISKEYHASWINVQLIFETKVNRTRRSDSQALLLIKKKKRKKKESNWIHKWTEACININRWKRNQTNYCSLSKKKIRNFFSRRYSTRGRLFSDSREKLPVHFMGEQEIFLWTVTHRDKLLLTITSLSLSLLVINKSFSTHSFISNVIIC